MQQDDLWLDVSIQTKSNQELEYIVLASKEMRLSVGKNVGKKVSPHHRYYTCKDPNIHSLPAEPWVQYLGQVWEEL